MLYIGVNLEPQPGGVMPEIHLKKGSSSVLLRFFIDAKNVLEDIYWKTYVITASLPNGNELFSSGRIQKDDSGRYTAVLSSVFVGRATRKVGSFKGAVTILDYEDSVTRDNYLNHKIQTVLPFKVIVHDSAGGD